MIRRSEIVVAAKSFLGTPWKHQGRSPKGVDCVGLIYAVAVHLGAIKEGEVEIPPYRRQPDGTLLDYFDRYMDRARLTDLKPGMAVIFEFMGSPYHAGIVTDTRRRAIVHAFAPSKKVVVDMLDNTQKGRKLIRAYDYRGVADG